MTIRTRILRWFVTGATCIALGTALAAPQLLPDPLARTVNAAVNGAAHIWLWVLNEPV